MPKSKRDKIVSLSKVKKKDRNWKEKIITTVRSLIDGNDKFKELRESLQNSSRIALGRSPSEEHFTGISKLSESIKGSVGLLFTNLSDEEVTNLFENWEHLDYARVGAIVSEDVKLRAGPLEIDDSPVPPTLEPLLRKHGLPIRLNKGVVELLNDHVVCKVGDHLSVDQAAILKLFHKPLATFHFDIVGCWHKKDANFIKLGVE